VFEQRPNRYLASVRLQGQSVPVHVPDPGRMKELLVPGRRVWVSPAENNTGRSTRFSLVLVEAGDNFVSVNTLIPNRLVAQAFRSGAIPQFRDYTEVRAEVPHGRSRFDFVLTGGNRQCVVEVKSVSLARNRIGLFPDAVSARASKHAQELAALRRQGWRAAVVFVAQREDVDEVRPATEIDPVFASTMEQAREAGVEFFGFRCEVSLNGIRLGAPVPVR